MRRQIMAFALGLAVVACSGGENGSSSSASPVPGSPPPPPSSPPSDAPPGPPPPALQKVIISRNVGGDPNTGATVNRLYIINEDGTGAVTIAEQSGGFSTYRATLPSGRILFETAFHAERQSDLFSVNADGTGLLNLTDSPESERFHAITSSGRVIFSIAGSGADRYGVLSVAGDGSGQCTIVAASDEVRFVSTAVDDHVIFERCSVGNCSLYVGSCSGTTQLTAGSTRFIGTTLSGKIAYAVATINEETGRDATKLYTNKLDGSDLKEIGAAGDIGNISAKIFGESLIWVQGGTIRLASVEGGMSIVLADENTSRLAPQRISPSGRLIYQVGFGNRIEEVTDLYSVRLDGADRRQIAGTTGIEIFSGMTASGRVLYQRQPDPRINDPIVYEIRSVKDDGSDNVGLGIEPRTNAVDAVTQTNRVVYVNGDHEQRYDLYAVNEDGTDNRFLLSSARYHASTLNDRIIFGSQCRSLVRTDIPVVRQICNGTTGNIVAVKSDGTGLISLASDSEPVGFAGLYEPKENARTD